MGRGRFSSSEIALLKANKYVIDVNETRIIYSNEFKHHFIKEYKLGKKPTCIFQEDGFSPEVLGSKRIERACARWREADAAGTLGQHGYVQTDRKKKRQSLLDKKELQLSRQKNNYERKLEKQAAHNLKHLRRQQTEIEKLKAENELLKKVGKLGRRRCDRKVYGKTDLCELVDETVTKYKLHNCVKALCKAVGLPRSNYYYWKNSVDKRAERDEKDMESLFFVKEAYNSCKYYKQGARSIRMILHRKFCVNYNRKRISRIMRKYNIVCPIKCRNPYRDIWKAGKEDKIVPNKLNRKFKTGKARKVFLTDITYIKHQDHFTYLQMIIDAETKEPLAHAISKSLKMDFVLESLKQLDKYDFAEGAMIHSDQGVHYTSKAFRETVKEMGLDQSMSRRGNCIDNSPMESFFGHMKQEMKFDKNASDEEIKQQLEAYIQDYWYNRYQDGLGERTPYEYGQSLLMA